MRVFPKSGRLHIQAAVLCMPLRVAEAGDCLSVHTCRAYREARLGTFMLLLVSPFGEHRHAPCRPDPLPPVDSILLPAKVPAALVSVSKTRSFNISDHRSAPVHAHFNALHDPLASYAMLHPDGQQSIRQPRGRFGFSQRRPGTSQSARHRIAIGWILHSGGLRRSESRSAGVAASRPGTLLHGILVHPFSTPPSYPVPLPDYP